MPYLTMNVMTNQFAAITLNLIPGLGSVRIRRLMDVFGSPEIILHANQALLMQVKGIGPELARAITSWRTTINAEKEYELAGKKGIAITTLFDDDYPESLRNIHDPPIVLYRMGTWNSGDTERAISIVGSRMASHYGRIVSRRFAYELAETGITIVSGLAQGVDTEAHRAALAAHGRTIAVIGSGFNCLYPADNNQLARQIAEGRGAVISEFPMELRPGKTTFPMRNRIISGWSAATVVIEAPRRSGSLITAHQAIEQGRYVYAVPGPIDRPHSEGCHDLIRNGASLVTHPHQILDDLGWKLHQQLELFPKKPLPGNTPPPLLDSTEQMILDGIGKGFNHLDALCSFTSLNTSDINMALARLQIRKYIMPSPGGAFMIHSS